ncbi:MAG TPA: response regulator transcription factor [Zoogloea sp.]|uniref:response regulator transcription factor n=1 Tax=Zoogloea sp. TaxID=49181 RepID=UPI002BB6791B|nr:response regulator transcription factor [Zoogloea sp.]HMV18667.1 response regulator transcription factor [Rhodocyclaceae bacterium]HMV63523.1 response regulator transcription factor [Rhodocyclaceae bacterium]HMW51769.1 response regulator transcription factor [Rhodocyclaceae bacterium]HMY51145.1 response regulator transcription factor [Rhodocyclaceae bacterium]HMZ76808.1 response regulator transcription factor [Rhodocyclaceae bacterium]
MLEPTRLLLVDDHAVVREGYRRLLETRAELRIVGEAATARDALDAFRRLAPDVLVLDLGLPDMGGVELIRRLLQREPGARILVFTMHREPLFATQALRAGAQGYVTKSSPPEVLVQAVLQVAAGRPFISPDLAPELALALVDRPRAPLADLAPREFEILRLLLEGLDPEEIGRRLSLSAKTVRNCHYQIKSKLGVRSDIELTRLAMAHGLV